MTKIIAVGKALAAMEAEDKQRASGLRREIEALLRESHLDRVAEVNADRRRIRMWAMDHAVRLCEKDLSLLERSLPEIAADIEAYVTAK